MGIVSREGLRRDSRPGIGVAIDLTSRKRDSSDGTLPIKEKEGISRDVKIKSKYKK